MMGFDNLLGAIASHLGVHLSEKAYLLSIAQWSLYQMKI